MSDDKYTMNIEDGADLVIKRGQLYLVGKTIGMPEDIGLPPEFMKEKHAIFYGENINLITGNPQTFSFAVGPDSCKKLADFLLKVWEESK